MLLNARPCTGQPPPPRMRQPQMSVVPQLRNLLEISAVIVSSLSYFLLTVTFLEESSHLP